MKEILGVLIIVAVLALSAMLSIWCLNSLAEAGGSDFYIEHNLWNYWVASVSAIVLKSTSSS